MTDETIQPPKPRELTDEEKRMVADFNARYNAGAGLAEKLRPILMEHNKGELVFAAGILLGAQATNDDELKAYIGTAIHVAQHQFYFCDHAKAPETLDASEAQPS